MYTKKPERERAEKLRLLRAEFDELTRSLPKHGVKASQLIRLEELEDEIAELENKLNENES